jgi:hypothetical protein
MIRVFDKMTPMGKFRNTDYTHFDTLGIAVLNPLTAYITEELNGEYSYEVVCPIIDSDDSWKALSAYNIIRASNGQLFVIKKLTFAAVNGIPCVKAYAQHIWYYLSDAHVVNYERYDAPEWHVHHLINDIWNENELGNGSGTIYKEQSHLIPYREYMDWSVNITPNTGTSIKFKHVSLAYAILGAPDSIVNKYNAYLYRDNFSFNISSGAMKNSRINAFTLDVSNCTEVKATWDYMDRISQYHVWDQNGNYYSIGWGLDDGAIQHHVIEGTDISTPEGYNGLDYVIENGNKYWEEHKFEKRSYEVNYVDTYDSVRDEGWERLRTLKVGDSGQITDWRGVTDTQMIIATKYNDITQRLDSLKLGKFIHSDIHQTRWDKIKSGDNAAYRRLDLVEQQQNYFKLIKDEEK